MNQWADQLVEGVDLYRDGLLAGAKTAWETNSLVTTAVRPEYAHPGLEYVRKGEHFDNFDNTDVYKVDKFIERPERSGKDVEEIYKDKRSLWHTAPWIWKADLFLSKVHKHALPTYERLMVIDKSLSEKKWQEKINKVYSESPKVQIDMVISKDQDEMYVVEGGYDWLDLGDFNVLWKMAKKDENRNSSLLKNDSDWLDIETEGTYVLSSGKKTIITVGLKDMVVVSLDDAVLVIPREKSQDVKKVVELLKEKKRVDLL